jgi:tetratricopeptide (TPR) repeat protein
MFAELPVTMEGLRPVVQTKINGADARLVADSGAFFSMLSPAAAAEFKLPKRAAPFGMYIQGFGGGTTTPQIATVQAFTLANYTIPKVDFLIGGNEPGAGTVGLLGQNLMRMADVEYDLGNGILRLIKSENCGKRSLAYWATASQPFAIVDMRTPTAASPTPNGVAFVNGVEVRVAFDTGSPTSVLSLSAAKRAGITPSSAGVRPAGVTHGLTHDAVNLWAAPVASFKVGDEEIRHTQVLIADLRIPGIDMLLGDDFFLSHRIYVANGQEKIYLTYNGGAVFDLEGARRAQPAADSTSSAGVPAVTATDANSGALVEPAAAATSAAPTRNTDRSDQPVDASGFMRRGTAYAARKDLEHALADLRRACELAPREPDYHYELGRVRWEAGQPDLALQEFDKTLELKPDHVAALFARAQLRQARHSVAREDLDAIDRLAAPEDNLRLELGWMYEALGQSSTAVHQFDLWISSHPQDAQLAKGLNARCWSQAEANQNLDRALTDCNAALRLQPKRANFLDSRGLVRLRRGEFDLSIADYDAALALRPKVATSLYGRGLAKLRKGLEAEGRADLAAASALDHDIAEFFAGLGLKL